MGQPLLRAEGFQPSHANDCHLLPCLYKRVSDSFTGFAIATWSLGAVFVLLVSAANLIPRAFQVHEWYKEKFPDYPRQRKVLVPYLL